VVLHRTAGAESVTWESAASYYVQSRGFAGIGYHVGVRNGEIAYQAASCHRRVKVDGALSALRDAITALEELLAAAEPAKGHSALRAGVVLRGAQSTCDVLRARARAAGLFDPTHRGYRPGQNPPAGAGHRMSLAISA